MACKINYYVRVTQQPPDAYNAVLIYTAPPPANTAPVSSNPVNEIPFSGTTTLCFSEDPASTVKKIHIDVDSCGGLCDLPPTWQNQVMAVVVHSPSIGSGGPPLLLKAQETTTSIWHYASTNPPGIDGGRPIIRNTFSNGIIYVAIAIVAIGVIYMFAKWWNSSQPKGP